MNSSNDEPDELDAALCLAPSEDRRIDLQEFLDFLILAYRVNDVLTSDGEKHALDPCVEWTELSRNGLFLRLSDEKHDREDDSGAERTTMPGASIERVQCTLKHKLKDVVNEGILDSVLPFIVKKTLTTNVLNASEPFGTKVGNPPNKDKTCLKPKLNANDGQMRSKGE